MKKILFFLLILLPFWAYSNSLFNHFLRDDIGLIVNNPFIKNFKFLPMYFKTGIFYASNTNTATPSNFYRPMQTILYAIIYHIFGLNVVPYHLLNIFLHIGNAILIYILLKKIYPENISFLSSLLWAIHPIQTEAITYVSGTADPLCLFWTLLTILFFSSRRYILSLIFFVLSFLSKETAVLTPFLLLIYEHARNSSSVLSSYSGRDDIKIEDGYKKKWWTFIFFYISLIYGILRLTILKFAIIGEDSAFLPRFFTSFKAFFLYIWTLVFPFVLGIGREIPYVSSFFSNIKDPYFIAGFILFAAFLFFLWKKRKNPYILFAGSWFFISYSIVSDIALPVNGNFREHWMYTPSIGFFILFILGYEKLKDKIILKFKKFPSLKKYAYVPLFIIFVLYGTRTFIKNFDWRNQKVLVMTSLKHAPYSPLLHRWYGDILLGERKYKEALSEFRYSYALNSDNPLPYFINTANTYLYMKNYKMAGKYWKKILKIQPDNVFALYGISVMLEKTGHTGKSINLLKAVIRKHRFLEFPYHRLGIIYFEKNDYQDAEKYLKSAIGLNPQDSTAHCFLGLIFMKQHNYPSALSQMRTATELNPENPTFLLDTARLCQILHINEKAIVYFKKYLSIYPGNISVLNDMAISLFITGNKQSAINIWEGILKKYPDYKEAKINLEKTLK
ncbi:MAG: tetratricopeptide repeat protein [Candidatus Omnitrophica bacterium]|nr:tetratricopeptide repeat protein [Candidatus Omnitrophota bacterium]